MQYHKLVISFSSRDLPFLLATASNTWGLLILALLLGYGLVEVPRTLWYASRRKYTLNHCYFKAAKLYSDMSDANEKLNEVTEVYIYLYVVDCDATSISS